MFGYDLAYGFQIGNIEIGRLYAVYVVDVGEDVAVRTALSDDAYFVAELTVPLQGLFSCYVNSG